MTLSEIQELQRKLQDTRTLIAKLELALARDPESAILRLNLASVVNRSVSLEARIDDYH